MNIPATNKPADLDMNAVVSIEDHDKAIAWLREAIIGMDYKINLRLREGGDEASVAKLRLARDKTRSRLEYLEVRLGRLESRYEEKIALLEEICKKLADFPEIWDWGNEIIEVIEEGLPPTQRGIFTSLIQGA